MEDDAEVLRDPRKIFYKSGEELKKGLVALSLAVALTKNFSRKVYTKEFFEDNIRVERNKNGNMIMKFNDAFASRDTYVLEMNNQQNEIIGLLLVMAVEIALHDKD